MELTSKITYRQTPTEGSLVVNGHDISGIIAPQITLSKGGHGDPFPRLTVDFMPDQFEYEGAAVVGVSTEVAEALTTLGWTAPAVVTR